MPRRLAPSDRLYRAVDPEHWDENGLTAFAFEDPGKPYNSQSFFVATVAKPANALLTLARYGRARELCGTGNVPPTPLEMYRRGYRVAAISADFILKAIDATRGKENPIKITLDQEHDYRTDGHINILNAKHHGRTLAKEAQILSEDETLGT